MDGLGPILILEYALADLVSRTFPDKIGPTSLQSLFKKRKTDKT